MPKKFGADFWPTLTLHTSTMFRRGRELASKLIRLEGYGLTTAEIHYHLPDHPSLLQQFVWQEYDIAPLFPGLKAFLSHWEKDIQGALHSVRIAHNQLVKASEWKAVDGVFRLN